MIRPSNRSIEEEELVSDEQSTCERLPREAFVLVHMEGLTAREAAALLEMPAGTLKSHLHRAIGKLRRELADLQDPAREEGHEEA